MANPDATTPASPMRVPPAALKLPPKPFALPSAVVLVAGAMCPALISLGAGVGHPAWAAVFQILGIVSAGLAGHALPQPKWAAGKPIIPAGLISAAAMVDTVLYQLAQAQSGGLTQAALYAAASAVAFVAGLHSPPPLAANAPGGAQAGFASIRTLLVLLVLPLAACATLRALWTDEVDCAKQNEMDLAASIPTVATALAQKDFAGALDTVVAKVGQDLVACSVAMLQQTPPKTGVGVMPAILPAQPPLPQNATAYLKAKGLKPFNVPQLSAVTALSGKAWAP